MQTNSKIYVAGAETLIGEAIVRTLQNRGYTQVINGSNNEADLLHPGVLNDFFAENRPDYVFLVAGKSGGIRANQKYPAELMLDNLIATCNVVNAAHRYSVKKMLYLASSCCYPRGSPQPMRVDYLMTGPLEPTNEAYASAKLIGLKLCEAYCRQYSCRFICGIPANVFGTGDDFSLDDSHVIAALIRKMHDAKSAGEPYVELWGTGTPEREFIFADDVGDACLFLMDRYDDPMPINIGAPSQRFSISDLAFHVKEAVGYSGEVRFDIRRPDGMPRKILDSEPLRNLGWSPKTDFRFALRATYEDFLQLETGKEISRV
jgi:GDP-L-fucose synthase